MVFLSLPWSLELYEQTVGRLHRSGQSRDVWVYILMANLPVALENVKNVEPELAAAATAWQSALGIQHYLAVAGREAAHLPAALETLCTASAFLAPAILLHLASLWAKFPRYVTHGLCLLLYPAAVLVWWAVPGHGAWLFALAVGLSAVVMVPVGIYGGRLLSRFVSTLSTRYLVPGIAILTNGNKAHRWLYALALKALGAL